MEIKNFQDSKINDKQISMGKISKLKEKFRKSSRTILRRIAGFFGLRQTKYGTNTLVAILAVLGILIILNFIAYKENIRWDLTKNKKFTLSDQTIKVLEKVDQEVKVIAFYQNRNPMRRELENLLKEYQEKNKNIKVEFIDPDEKPALAQKYEVDRYGMIVFVKGDKKERTTGSSESDITSAILKLFKEEQKNIYFLTGHGEKNIEGFDEKGYSSIKASLEKEGYKVSSLRLLTKPEIPKDIAVLVVASPKKKLLDKEKEAISQYLENGGKVFFLLDPKVEAKEETGLKEILDKWGINWDNNLVIDPERYLWTDVGTPVIEEWTLHQITHNLPAAFFPAVSKVAPKKDLPSDLSVTSLAKTSSNSWLEKTSQSRQVKFDEGKDEKGPVSIACVVQKEEISIEKKEETQKQSKTRLVVIGDSDFAINMFTGSLANQDLFLNAVDWLAEEEELISIRPKEEEQRTVTLTSGQSRLIFYVTVIGMPLVVIVVGVVVWINRRKQKKKGKK